MVEGRISPGKSSPGSNRLDPSRHHLNQSPKLARNHSRSRNRNHNHNRLLNLNLNLHLNLNLTLHPHPERKILPSPNRSLSRSLNRRRHKPLHLGQVRQSRKLLKGHGKRPEKRPKGGKRSARPRRLSRSVGKTPPVDCGN